MKNFLAVSVVLSVLLAAPATLPVCADTALTAVTMRRAEDAGVRLIPPLGHLSDIMDIGVTPDGRRIATSAWDGTARVWDRETGREIRAFTVGDPMVFGVAISPDGETVYTSAPSGLSAWSVGDGHQIWHTGGAGGYDIALSPDGGVIAVSNNRGNTGYICSARTGSILQTLNTAEVTYSAAFSPNGQHILLGGDAGTVSLWTAAGNAEGTFSGHTKSVECVTFSPDGARIATGSRDGTLRIWDVATKRELRQIRVGGDYESIGSVEWAPDGKTIASSHVLSSKDGLYLWNPETGAQVGYTKTQDRVRKLYFLSDSRALVVGLDGGTTMLFATAPLALIRSFVGQSQEIQSLTTSADGRSLFVGLYPDRRLADSFPSNGTGVVQVDLGSGRLVRNFNGMMWGARQVTVSPDGSRLITAGDNQSLAIFDTRTAKRLVNVDNYQGSNTGALSPDGKLLAYEDRRTSKERNEKGGWGCVGLFNAQTGALVRTLTHPNMSDTDTSVAIGFSPDGQFVFNITDKQRIHTWNVQTGALVKDTQKTDSNDNGNHFYGAAVEVGTTRVALGRNQPALWDAVSGTEIRRFVGDEVTCYAFSRDGKRLVGGSRTSVYVWDTETGATLKRWNTPGIIKTIALSPDGKRVFYAGIDTVLRVADTDTGEERLSYLVLTGGDWLALSPSGTFDGSPGGISRVSFESGGKTFDVSQFTERFLQTGLVAAALGAKTDIGADVPPPPAPIAEVIASLPPVVRLTAASSAITPTIEVTVEATEQAGGGVKAIRLYQNGRLVGGPSAIRGIAVEAVNGATTTKKFTVALESGINQLRAVAYSKTDLESKAADAAVTFHPASVPKPVLHVLSVGINTYKDATMNLTYARPDAESLADLFDSAKGGKAGGNLFASVQVSRLVDAGATGAAILAGINELASTKPEDVVMIYLAGHGETAGDSWYFLPAEMHQMALPERVRKFGIPWSKIEAAVGRIPARKIVLVLDACKSGAVVNGVRGGVGEQQALAIMARAQGIHILTASNGQQYAGEVKALGHGILTYALLEGLGGKAARPGDATVMISELMSYVDQRVPELSLKYRGEEQYPTPLARGQNFPVAGHK